MGLEGVELLLELEDEFGLAIPDDEARRMDTLGDTRDFIVRCLQDRWPAAVCPGGRQFYRLRRELMTRFGIPRRDIRPRSRLDVLVPPGRARQSWPDIARSAGIKATTWNRPGGFFSTRAPDRFPPPGSTLGHIVKQSLDDRAYALPDGRVDEAAVWRMVAAIVSELVGIREADLHPGLRYVRDLNF